VALGGALFQMFAPVAGAAKEATMGKSATGDSNGVMMAGTAKIDITPKQGEARDIRNRDLRLHDSLYARVLCLRQGGTTLAIVSLDLGIFASERVVREAKEKFGVDHVLLCCTHTHATPIAEALVIKPPLGDWTRKPVDPGTIIDWSKLSSDPWHAAVEEKILQAIGEASKKLFPARVTGGEGPFQSAYMAHNRRLVRPDGKVEMMWDNPNRIPTSPIDPTVGFIRVEDMDGKVRAFAVHYACHPVGTMKTDFISRDFPGATVDYIEEQLGADCMAMFLQGASGDLDPYDLRLTGQHQLDVIKQAGISLGKGALKVSKSVPTPVNGAPGSLKVETNLLAIQNRDGKASTEVRIATVVINGGMALVAIPGEPFIQHQLDLRELSPVSNAFMLGISYSGEGSPFVIYLPTVKAVEEGGYGATECSFLEPGAGALIVEAAVASLKRCKE
jgi:neutral ceramidase